MGRKCCTDRKTQDTVNYINSLPYLFGETVKTHRKSKGWEQGDLAYETGISKRQIQRIESGELLRPRIGLVIALCVAFNLDAHCCWDLINKSGHASFFSLSDPESAKYFSIIIEKDKKTVRYWNKYLIEHNIEPLTNDIYNTSSKSVSKDKATV